jgi:hypothetical protein
MRSVAAAIGLEIWWKNRRVFQVLLAVIPAFALLWFLGMGLLQDREGSWSTLLQTITLVAMVGSLACVFTCFDYTEEGSRGALAGFPPRLYTMPVRTWWLVTCPVLYGVTAVTLVYAAWALAVFRPAGVVLPLAWPLLFLATGMVCYQCVIWSLAGFRLTRLIAMGVLVTGLVGLGIIGFRPELKVVLGEHFHLVILARAFCPAARPGRMSASGRSQLPA